MPKRWILLLFPIFIPHLLMAATLSSVQSGNWSAPATWEGGNIPGDGDEVVIAEGHTVWIDQNVGTPGGGLRMLQVGTREGSTAELKFDGSLPGLGCPAECKIIFGSTGKTKGASAFGIRFFGAVDFVGTAECRLVLEPGLLDGSAYTFIEKGPDITKVRVRIQNTTLRFLGDGDHAGLDARGAKKAGDRFVFVDNRLERSGSIWVGESDGGAAEIKISGNEATDHQGPFLYFRSAQNLTISHNRVTLVSIGTIGEAIIDGYQGPGSNLRIEKNQLVSRINADGVSRRFYGVWLADFSASTVLGNRISAEGVGYGFEEGVSILGRPGNASEVVIAENVISNTIHGVGIHTTVTSNPGIVITRNRIFDNRNEHIYISHGYRLEITNNVLWGFLHSGQAGILLYSSDEVRIANNTLDGPQAPNLVGIAVGGQGASKNVVIRNNILTGWDKAIQNRPVGNTFIDVSHNLFFSNGKNYDQDPIPSAGEGDVVGDPRFVDPGSRDYRLQGSSPAIDWGGSEYAPALDADGDPRPVGRGIDIGADEFAAPRPRADLAISVKTDHDSVLLGAAVTYTFIVENEGPDTASRVEVIDALPGGLSYISAVPSRGACSSSDGRVLCRLGELSAGEQARVDIVASARALGKIRNSASVNQEEDPEPGNNTAGQEINVIPVPVTDLAVAFEDDLDPVKVKVGDPILYKIVVSNRGTSEPVAVTVTDAFPSTVVYRSAAPSQGTGPVRCDLGPMQRGSRVSIEVIVVPMEAGRIENTVSVQSELLDSAPANDQATHLTFVESPIPSRPERANLTVRLHAPSEGLVVQVPWTDTIVITNEGPDRATDVQVAFDLGSYSQISTATPGQGSCLMPSGPCDLGTLEVNTEVTITRTVTPLSAGTFLNRVTVTSAVSDTDLGNNSDAKEMTIGSPTPPGGKPPVSIPSADPGSGSGAGSSSGFGCGSLQTGSGQKRFRPSDLGDLLLLSFPFFYRFFRDRKRNWAGLASNTHARCIPRPLGRGLDARIQIDSSPFGSKIPRRLLRGIFNRPAAEKTGLRWILFVAMLLLPLELQAALITSSRSGNWSDPATWAGGRVPGDGDEVIIANGHSVRINQSVGSSSGGLLMLHVGTSNATPPAELIFDGAALPFKAEGYTLTFASTGKIIGQNAYGIRFWGKIQIKGTPKGPSERRLTLQPRVLNGNAFTFLHKEEGAGRIDFTLQNANLRFVGDENTPGIDVQEANKPGDSLLLMENTFDQSGFIHLDEADGDTGGGKAKITLSKNVATLHKGSFVQFRAARNLTINENNITLASFGTDGQAIIDSRQGEGVGGLIRVEGNILSSRIDADRPDSRQIYGIWLQGFSNSSIRGNRILAEGVDYGFEEGIHILGGAGDSLNIVIDGNIISDTIHGIGIDTTDAHNPGIEVTRNRIFNNRNEHIFISKGFQVRITNNILYGSVHPGQAGILLYNTNQISIINNTLDGNGGNLIAGIAIGNKGIGISKDVVIRNNIITNWEEGISNRPAGNTFREVGYSLFSGNVKNYDDAGTTASTQIPLPVGDVNGDPVFVRPASGDFHIQASSAAMNRGSRIDAPLFDFDGQRRPDGNGFDIGADEFSNQAVSNPPPSPCVDGVGPSALCDATPNGGQNSGDAVPSLSSEEGGGGCSMVIPRVSKGEWRAGLGDILFLSVPFLYAGFRRVLGHYRKRGVRTQGLRFFP